MIMIRIRITITNNPSGYALWSVAIFRLGRWLFKSWCFQNQWWLWHLIKTTLKMSEISNKRSLNNGVEAAEKKGEGFLHSICPLGHHSATARRKCSKEDNKMAIL